MTTAQWAIAALTANDLWCLVLQIRRRPCKENFYAAIPWAALQLAAYFAAGFFADPWRWPQYLTAFLYGVGLIMSSVNHGKDKTLGAMPTYTCALLFVLWIRWCGGFYAPMVAQ